MEYMKSLFTDILQELGRYSEQVDCGTITQDEHRDYQQLEGRIIRAHESGRFQEGEYRALIEAFRYIEAGARIVLGLDDPQEGQA